MNSTVRLCRLVAIWAVLPWVGFAPAAFAQTSAIAPGDSTSSTELAEVVVTAQRTAESAQKVPISMTVLSGETLASRDIIDLDQLTLLAPSLQLGSDNSFAIRGVGTLAFSVNLDASVGVAYDDVNLALPLLATNLLNDVSRVEVLYGPQGLLFGRNATSGLINVVSNRPVLGKTELVTDAEYDYRDTAASGSQGVLAHAIVNAPIGDSSAIRVNGFYNNQSPFTQYLGGGAPIVEQGLREYGVRGKYLYEPNDALDVYVIGEITEHRGTAGNEDNTYRALGPGSNDAAPLAADNVTPGVNNIQYSNDGSSFRNLVTSGLQGNVEYKLANGWQLTEIAAWKEYHLDAAEDTDDTSLNGASLNHDHQSFNQYSNEFRVTTSKDERIYGQAGLFYMHTDVDDHLVIDGNNYLPGFLLPTFPFCVGATVLGPPPGACPVSNVAFIGLDSQTAEKTDSYAAFGQATFKFTNDFRGILGGRLTHDHNSIVSIQDQMNYFVPLGGPSATFPAAESATNFSYKVGLEYDVMKDVMAYATYSTGYKGPGFTTKVTLDSSQIVRPEKNKDIELGFKSRFLDRRLGLNVALFHSKYTDYQSQSLNPVLMTFVTQNAAAATTEGAELSVEARPIAGLSLSVATSYLDSKFDDFPGAQCYLFQPGCVAGTFNAGGLTTPTSPRFTTTLGARYERPITGSISTYLDVSEYLRSRMNFAINQAPGEEIGPTHILTAALGLMGNDRWSAALFCKNCTDQRVPQNISLDAGDESSGVANTYLQSFGFDSFRTVGLRASMKF